MLLGFVVMVWCFFAPLFASEWNAEIMPLKDVQPGMSGIGKTVFYGEEIEDFGVQVVDIIKDFYPKTDIILVRLTGAKAEKTGVVSGMSGSPVYIDGKLVGALSLRFGQFMKEPIGGVMPIEHMFKLVSSENVRQIETGLSGGNIMSYLQSALIKPEENFWVKQFKTVPETNSTFPSLKNIHAPLVFSGFNEEIISPYQDVFETMGFKVMAGGGQSSQTDVPKDFQPGSAVSQVFISGDYTIEATGTVTAVNDHRILAFGHQIFNLGPVNFPMSHAKILVTLPSLMGSSKMAVATDIVGTFRQDRLAGVLGDLSVLPEMVPVSLDINSPIDGKNNYSFKMASDRSLNNLMPFFLRIALIQGLTTARLSSSNNSLYLNGTIHFSDGRKLNFKDFFSSYQNLGFFAPGNDVTAVGDLVAGLMGVLMVNNFKAPEVTKVDLSVQNVPGEHVAGISSIQLDKVEVSPGDSLTLTIRLKDSFENRKNIVEKIKLPQKISAKKLTLIVSCSETLTQYEVQASRYRFVPKNFRHLLEILSRRRQSNNIYIQLRARETGLAINDDELVGLPPSIMNVMNSESIQGEENVMNDRVLYETNISTEYMLRGAKKMSVNIKQPAKAVVPSFDEETPKETFFW